MIRSTRQRQCLQLARALADTHSTRDKQLEPLNVKRFSGLGFDSMETNYVNILFINT